MVVDGDGGRHDKEVLAEAAGYLAPPLKPMEEAPRDGRRILIKEVTMGYVGAGDGWVPHGTAWVDAYWDSGSEYTELVGGTYVRKTGAWRAWAGNNRVKSSHSVTRPLGWVDLPDEDETFSPGCR